MHPDKQKGKPAAQVMLAERVFEKLKVRACCCGVRGVATHWGHGRVTASVAAAHPGVA
eukprot:COSAG06_NODE_44601_length_362_cov_0.600760_1_plen_57_part_10